MPLKFLFFLPLFFITSGKCLAQEQQGQDVMEQNVQEILTIEPKQDSTILIERPKFRPKELYVPAGLMALGLISEGKTKQEVRQWRDKQIPRFRNKFDDYLQFAPHAAVYGFDGNETQNRLEKPSSHTYQRTHHNYRDGSFNENINQQ